jgi:hypothetical protein
VASNKNWKLKITTANKGGRQKIRKNTDIIFLTTVEDIRTSSKKWLHKNLLVLLVNKTDTRTTHLSKGVII